MSNLKELLAQRAELDAKIAETQNAEKASAISQVRTLMAEYEISYSELQGKKTKAPAGSRTPVAAKFKDQQTGDSWSGRGLKPKWLAAKIAAGASLDSFRV